MVELSCASLSPASQPTISWWCWSVSLSRHGGLIFYIPAFCDFITPVLCNTPSAIKLVIPGAWRRTKKKETVNHDFKYYNLIAHPRGLIQLYNGWGGVGGQRRISISYIELIQTLTKLLVNVFYRVNFISKFSWESGSELLNRMQAEEEGIGIRIKSWLNEDLFFCCDSAQISVFKLLLKWQRKFT